MTNVELVERRLVGRRLAWFRSDSDAEFWNQHWKSTLKPEFYARYRKGALGDYSRIFPRFLPREGRILEGGCGLGQYVVAMRARGYDMEGVDLAEETVRGVRNLLPDMPIHCQDVTKLPVPDGDYAGYVSLGVVEHLYTGPEPFLAEAFRVLRSGGTAIFTVPYVHVLRRLKARLGAYSTAPSSLPFYQYAFTSDEFTGLLKAAGFSVVHIGAINALKGIRDEWPWFRRWYDSRKGGLIRWGILYLTRVTPLFERMFGHMLLVVVRKS